MLVKYDDIEFGMRKMHWRISLTVILTKKKIKTKKLSKQDKK